jgi:L-seryl-tRNA(Ser) seleniumtransferase
MALAGVPEIEHRAGALASMLRDVPAKIELVDGFSTTGGGSAPTSKIPTVLVEIAPGDRPVAGLRQALIDADPPVIARLEEDRLVLDLRTVAPRQDPVLADVLRRVLG